MTFCKGAYFAPQVCYLCGVFRRQGLRIPPAARQLETIICNYIVTH